MARTRLIRPAFFKHAELYDAEIATGLPLRVAFAGLWTVTDRAGRFVWKPRDLKTDILPHDPLDFETVLSALEAHGFVQRYVVGGKLFGLIPTFGEHQTFHKTEPPSKLPPPEGPPLQPRSDTVADTADSVAVAVTGTVADTNNSAEGGSAAFQYAREVTAAACRAARQKWKAEPWVQGSTQSNTLALECIEAGIPLLVATQRITDLIDACGLPRPPRSIRYFLPGILEPNTAPSVRRERRNPGAQGYANAGGGRT